MTIHGPAQLTTVKGSIPRRINLSLAVGCTLLNAYQYFVLPLWLLPHSAWWAWTLVPCGLATWTMWAVLHEAFHGVLHPASRLNKRLGRWLAMQFFVLFRVVQFGHLTHHRFNRFELDRPDIVVPGRPLWLTRFIYYLRLLGGLYLGEMAYALVVWLPRRWLRGIPPQLPKIPRQQLLLDAPLHRAHRLALMMR